MNTNTIHATRNALSIVAAFVKERPNFCAGNYDSAAGYSADRRRAANQKGDALAALGSADNAARHLDRAGILSAEVLAAAIAAGNSTGSGRFQLLGTSDGFRAEYVCGQYWPTEYRNGAARWAKAFARELADVQARAQTDLIEQLKGQGMTAKGAALAAEYMQRNGHKLDDEGEVFGLFSVWYEGDRRHTFDTLAAAAEFAAVHGSNIYRA